jgi:hypothetical protein
MSTLDKFHLPGAPSKGPYTFEYDSLDTLQKKIRNADNPSYSDFDDQGKNIAVVLHTGDVNPAGGGLNHALVRALHILDLRIRGLNRSILYPPSLSNANLQGYSIRHYLEPRLVLKGNYIPNFLINAFYYLRGLVDPDINLTILPPVQNYSINMGAVERDSGIGACTKIRIIGDPIISKRDDSVDFVVLKFTEYKKGGTQLQSIVINNNPLPLWAGGGVASEYACLQYKIFGKDANYESGTLYTVQQIVNEKGDDVRIPLKNQINRFPQKDKIIKQAKRVVEILSKYFKDDQTASYLPVIINGPVSSDTIMNLGYPGIPLTLLDIAYFSHIPFTGATPSDNLSKHKLNVHALGKAIDISLAPYYAKTGMSLIQKDPYLLSGDFSHHSYGNLIVDEKINIKLRTKLSSSSDESIPSNIQYVRAQDFIEMNIVNVDGIKYRNGRLISEIKLNIEKIEDSQNKVEEVFDLLFTTPTEEGVKPVSPEFKYDALNDLIQDDRYWYHMQVDSVEFEHSREGEFKHG